jgi:WS/DGAT/MGAT family acyltransferase
MRELSILCSDLFSQKLDRRRPLWEMWYIEGLENGRVALFQKCHHCLIDGVSGAGLGEILCDLEPDPPPRQKGPKKRKPKRERVPDDLELTLRSLPAAFGTPFRTIRYVAQAANRGITMVKHLRDQDAPPMGADVPRAPWNDSIGPRRAFACASVSLETVRGIKQSLDVKVNDVVLELCGSAMRRYLKAQGEFPKQPMTAAVPVSTREPGDDTMDNKVAQMTVSLATDIDDPVERLLQIYRGTQKSKEMTEAIRAKKIQAMGDTFPPSLLNLAFRTLTLAPATGFPNATISNVPGPPAPLYTAGARLESMYPMSVLVAGAGLNITVVSYMGRMDFGFTVDPELIPDPWYLAEGVPKALEKLEKSVAAHAETVPLIDRRKGRRGRKSQPKGKAKLREVPIESFDRSDEGESE